MANAIVDPWAVMVHPEHTHVALRAVVGPRRLPGLWPFAFFAIAHVLMLALKRSFHSLLDLSRVRERSSDVRDKRHHAEAVESHKVKEPFSSQRNPYKSCQI